MCAAPGVDENAAGSSRTDAQVHFETACRGCLRLMQSQVVRESSPWRGAVCMPRKCGISGGLPIFRAACTLGASSIAAQVGLQRAAAVQNPRYGFLNSTVLLQ